MRLKEFFLWLHLDHSLVKHKNSYSFKYTSVKIIIRHINPYFFCTNLLNIECCSLILCFVGKCIHLLFSDLLTFVSLN